MSVLFVAALRWEAWTIIRQIKNLQRKVDRKATLWSRVGKGSEVAVLQTGIGPHLAERALSWASEMVSPSAVIVTGCAGGLVPDLRSGELVIAEEVVTPGAPARTANAKWIERYDRACLAVGVDARRGRLLATASILMSVEEKQRAASRERAIAVAMEDGAVAAWADARGLEFASVRAILDPLEMVIPKEISSLTGPTGRAYPSRVLAAIIDRPGVIAEFLRLGFAQRACRRALERVHRNVLDDSTTS